MNSENQKFGRLLAPFSEKYAGAKSLVVTPKTEVYTIPDSEGEGGSEFLMATDNGLLFKFALTGDMIGAYSVNGKVETLAEMDPQHRWSIATNGFPIEGMIGTNGSTLEGLVNFAHLRAQAVSKMTDNFEVLPYSAIVARFKFLQEMLTHTDIIPDQSPRTIIAKAGDGCMAKCNYCPEGEVPFTPFSREQYVSHLRKTKEGLIGILSERGIKRMNEAFVNVSDIGWLNIQEAKKKTNLTAVEAARLMREEFPWLERIGTFIGSSTALSLSKDPNGDYEVRGQGRYSPNFFSELRGEGNLVNRLYLGLETAHTQGSKILNKNITYEQKLTAAELIKAARIPLKVIIQLGVLGQGFYANDGTRTRFVEWQEHIDNTIEWINQVSPYRVLVSAYKPGSAGPRMGRLYEDGVIVHPKDPREQIAKELDRLRRSIKIDASVIETGYQNYVPEAGPRKFIMQAV